LKVSTLRVKGDRGKDLPKRGMQPTAESESKE